MLAYCAALGTLEALRWHLWTLGTDTGTFTQVVEHAFSGFTDGPEQGTHFRFHWAPMLATLYPLIATTHAPLCLQFAQIALIGASALPAYAIARRHADRETALGCALFVLLYPPLIGVAFTEFHEIAFYPLIALSLFWAADAGKWKAFAGLALASALVREEACMVFVFVGVALASAGALSIRGRARGRHASAGLLRGEPEEPEKLVAAGLGLAAVNAIALFYYFRVLLPSLGGWQPYGFYSYDFAEGPGAVVVALLAHPRHVRELLVLGRFTYLLEALVPLAFLPLFSRWSLLALPGLCIVLLSSDGIVWRMGSHYAAIWIPWLLLGSIAVLTRWNAIRPRHAELARRAGLALCTLFLIAFNPAHVAHYVRPAYPTGDARRALARIPRGAYFATHDEWFARAAAMQPNASVFVCPYQRYAVFADDYPNDYARTVIVPTLRREIAAGTTRILARYGHVAVYARTPVPGARPGTCTTPGNATLRRLTAAVAARSPADPSRR